MAENRNPPTDPDPFRETMDKMRQALEDNTSGALTRDQYKQQLVKLDSKLTGQIRNAFNAESGIVMARPEYNFGGFEFGGNSDIRAELKDNHAQYAGESINAEYNSDILETLRNKSNALNHLTLEGSIDLITKHHRDPYNSPETQIQLEFAAFTVRDSIHNKNAETMNALNNNGITEPHINALVRFSGILKNEKTPEFEVFEQEKCNQLLKIMQDDPELMGKIRQITPLTQINTQEEYFEQYKIRRGVAQDIAETYGNVYDLPVITKDDVYTPYPAYTDHNSNVAAGYLASSSSSLGTKNDDFIALNSNITAEFLQDPPPKDNAEAALYFLDTVHEELKHLVDTSYADQLLLGGMNEDNPALDHATRILLNEQLYIENGANYEQQYIEATAKEHAGLISNEQTDLAFKNIDQSTQPDNTITQALNTLPRP